MVLSLNEIKKRAVEFSREWRGETKERAEAQTFWNQFFNVFGVDRRRYIRFDEPSTKIDGKGFIDVFWKGKLVAEHKSAGRDLDKAYSQALDYFNGLKDEELPKYVIVTDFKNMRLYDLDENTEKSFDIANLVDNIDLFNFISGYERVIYEKEDPVNIKAAELMGKLHDSLKDNGYVGHNLEVLLVRLMFCLFADDTLIFEKDSFHIFIEKKTGIDGSNAGAQLNYLFEVLNTSEVRRQKNLDEELNRFPYIDGELFEEKIATPSFDSDTRKILLECCHFDWSKVSPPIFGSLFQSVMDPEQRHDLGGHYTSEKNILKVIKPLFLDGLKNEFESHKNNKRYLTDLLGKIGEIRILDPACGCGNFLMISYRELRRLQIAIRKRIMGLEDEISQKRLNIEFKEDLNVDSMYGIEILEFPALIAKVGLWLMDHLVNTELSKEMGQYYTRLPLQKTAKIAVGNALRMDWNQVVPINELSYITGNPPFISKQDRNSEQQEDMRIVCKNIKDFGLLDYVSCWYVKSIQYIKNTNIKVGFVSTNSITQGEQVGVLGEYLTNIEKINIIFAHRTFKWTSDARGKASVHVVIIGFAVCEVKEKFIYEYDKPDSEPGKIKANSINFYLIDYKNIYVFNRSRPICKVPEISFGSMPNDDGNFLFTEEEKTAFIKLEPEAKKFIKPLISAKEFLHNEKRWCLWLKDVSPSEWNKLKFVKERVLKVKEYRLKSKREATRKLSQYPYLFGEDRQPDSDYILIPRVSSENRKYIPIAFFDKNSIVGDTCLCVPNARLYHFGILTSEMHMAWMRQVCGRMKSDYRYSNNLVYNNFPWPDEPGKQKIDKIEECTKGIIKIRKEFNSSLADLYNPLTMPKKLIDTHKKLDKAVDSCYGSKSFKSDLERLKFLFDLYDKYSHKEK